MNKAHPSLTGEQKQSIMFRSESSGAYPAVVRAIPVIPQQQYPADEVVAAVAVDNGFPALWRKLRRQFDISTDQRLSCGLCGDAAIPFAVVTPCGHIVCQDCAEDSSRCPTCDRPILARTVVPQMLPIVLEATTFRCLTDKCRFSCKGQVDLAATHQCGRDARGDPLMEQVLDALRDAKCKLIPPALLLEVLSNYRLEPVPVPPMVLRTILDHLVIENAKNKTAAGSSSGLSHSKSRRHDAPAPPPPHQQRGDDHDLYRRNNDRNEDETEVEDPTLRRAHIFWDYNSVTPRKYGVAPSLFLDDLIDTFQRDVRVCCGEVRCIVYLPGRPGDERDEGELRELGVALRYAGGDAGAEDRAFRTCEALDGDLQQLIEDNLQEKVTLVDAILVTSEINFNAAKGILRDSGMRAHVVHDAMSRQDEKNLCLGVVSAMDAKLMPCIMRSASSKLAAAAVPRGEVLSLRRPDEDDDDDGNTIYEGRPRYIPPSHDWSSGDERYL